MDALLLAAGRGVRLSPITDSLPKCLVPILGRPLLDYWLSKLGCREEIERIFVNLHYLKDQVREFISKSPYQNKITLLDEERLLGTGGTLAELLKTHGPFTKGLFIAHADNFSHFSINDFLARHASRPSRCAATVMTFITDNPKSCGIFELDNDGVVLKMHEKIANPPGNLANAAVFIFEQEVLNEITVFSNQISGNTTADIFDLSRDFLPQLTGRMFTYLNTEYHRDIGSPEALLRAQTDALRLMLH
jgi:mannose-1-phosphate guanylyltransferase